MVLLLLGILVVAALLGTFLSRLEISPWGTLLVAAGVAAIALTQRSDVASCGTRDSGEALFAYGALVAVALFATAAVTALVDAVQFARSGQKGLAAGRLGLLLLGAALAFGTLALWVITLVSCLS
jgi:hypothetical protein